MHADIQALMERYDQLDGGERARVDGHCSVCAECRARFAVLREPAEPAASEPLPAPAAAAANGRRRAGYLAGIIVIVLAAGYWLVGGARPGLGPQRRPAPTPAPAVVLPTAAPLPPPTPVSGITPSPTIPPANLPPDALAWLRANAVPVRYTEPGNDLSDVGMLSGTIGDRPIVLLDSATTRGDHESLALRQRIMELLARDLNLHTVLIDAPWPDGELLNAYVEGGSGDPQQLLASMGGLWDTQEVLYTLRWLRAYNAGPGRGPRYISLHGYLPMQVYSPVPLEVLQGFLARVDPGADPIQPGSYRAIVSRLEAQRTEYTGRSSPEAYARARQAAQVLLQYSELAPSGQNQWQLGGMIQADTAALLDRLLDSAAGRTVVWGSNADALGTRSANAGIGNYLRSARGQEVTRIVFFFDHGRAYLSPGAPSAGASSPLAQRRIPRAPPNSYEALLRSGEAPRYLVDFRRERNYLSGWLLVPRLHRDLSNGFDECFPEDAWSQGALPQAYDALIFLDEITPVTPLWQAPAAQARVCPRAPQNLDFADDLDGWIPEVGPPASDTAANLAAAFAVQDIPGRGRRVVITGAGETQDEHSYQLSQAWRANDFCGRRVRITARVTAEVTPAPGGWHAASIMLSAQAIPPGPPGTGLACQSLDGIVGGQPISLVIDVPEDAYRLKFTVFVLGQGRVTLEDVHFDVVGPEVPTSLPPKPGA